MTIRACFVAGLLISASLPNALIAAPVLVSDGTDSYLVADNGIVSTVGTGITSEPVDTNTDHYIEVGQYSGQDLNVPDSWNGDRRWGNLEMDTLAAYSFANLENGDYNIYTSWRNVPQSNISLAHYQVSDDGPDVEIDQRIGSSAFGDLTLNDGTRNIDFAFIGTVSITDGDLSVLVDDTATGPGDEPGGTDFIHTDAIAIGPLPDITGVGECDFDRDDDCDGVDIDALMNEVAAGSHDVAFDLTGDGNVDHLDRDQWLFEAGPINGFAGALLVGDANLDGNVNAQDLNALGVTWQTDNNDWTNGNFVGGSTDASDLNELAKNWQESVSPAAAAVPEPSAPATLLPSLLLVATFLHVTLKRSQSA